MAGQDHGHTNHPPFQFMMRGLIVLLHEPRLCLSPLTFPLRKWKQADKYLLIFPSVTFPSLPSAARNNWHSRVNANVCSYVTESLTPRPLISCRTVPSHVLLLLSQCSFPPFFWMMPIVPVYLPHKASLLTPRFSPATAPFFKSTLMQNSFECCHHQLFTISFRFFLKPTPFHFCPYSLSLCSQCLLHSQPGG